MPLIDISNIYGKALSEIPVLAEKKGISAIAEKAGVGVPTVNDIVKARISDISCTIINGLIKKGIPFSFASARSINSASVVIKGLDFELPVVTYNGVSIVNPHLLTQNKIDIIPPDV